MKNPQVRAETIQMLALIELGYEHLGLPPQGIDCVMDDNGRPLRESTDFELVKSVMSTDPLFKGTIEQMAQKLLESPGFGHRMH